MKCPKCVHEVSKVLEKRDSTDIDSVRRRRECLKCKSRFTTYEKVEDTPLVVVKKDGQKEPFVREKFVSGILRSLEKRPIDMVQVDEFYKGVVSDLQKESKNGEVKSTDIGDIAMERLREIDEVAYIRFASVYKVFEDIEGFEKEIKKIRKIILKEGRA